MHCASSHSKRCRQNKNKLKHALKKMSNSLTIGKKWALKDEPLKKKISSKTFLDTHSIGYKVNRYNQQNK